MFKNIPIILLFLFAVSCNKSSDVKTDMQLEAATTAKKFTNVKFDSDIDPICKMSLAGGITDTVHYNGKIYGFCISRCKSTFLANPSAYTK